MSAVATRRGILGAIAVAPTALAAVPVAILPNSSARAESTSSNPRIQRAIALHDRADAECKRFDVEVEMPARKACAAALEAYPAEPSPPHEESSTTFVNMFGDTVRLSTEKIGTAAVARKVVNDPSWTDIGDEDWRQAHREIAAANERRDAVLAEQAARRRVFEEKTRAKFRIDEIAARSIALEDRRYQLMQVAIKTPAANLADVVTKLAFIERLFEDDEVDADVFSAIRTDVRRLAREARHETAEQKRDAVRDASATRGLICEEKLS